MKNLFSNNFLNHNLNSRWTFWSFTETCFLLDRHLHIHTHTGCYISVYIELCLDIDLVKYFGTRDLCVFLIKKGTSK